MKAATLLLLALCNLVVAQPAQHVVLISIDGLVPDYYLRPDRYGLKIPNLREMVAKGAWSPGAVGVFPTVTYPNHTAVVTGVNPAENGIVANGPLDPMEATNDGWFWYAEDLKSPALWDVVRKAGRKSGSVYWPVTLGAVIDYNFAEYRRVNHEDDVKLLRLLSSPGLVREVESKYGKIPGVRIVDRIRAQAACHILEKYKPSLMLLHLTDLDGAQHRSGPGSDEAVRTLEEIDQHFGLVRSAIRRAGLDAVTTIIIVSDHGFRATKMDFRPRAALREAGLIDVSATGAVKSWKVEAWLAGGTFALMPKDPADSQSMAAATALFRKLAQDPANGIARLYTPDEMKALGAFPGAFLVGETGEGFKVGGSTEGPLVAPTSTKGMHGYHPERPDQLASLLLFGAGVKRVELKGARLIDVAPTAASFLGLSMPSARGRVLKEAQR